MRLKKHSFIREGLSPLKGFSLIEMAMVLLIVGLLMAASLKAGVVYLSIEKRKITSARLSVIDSAMINYVSLNRRLPCPADGAIASGNANAGVEQRNAVNGVCTTMNRGVVPWVTLGVPESDAQDGWFNRFSYRVPSATAAIPNIGFTSNQALDMSSCDPAGTGPAVNRALAGHNVSTCNQIGPGNCEMLNLALCTSVGAYLNGRGIAIREALAGIAIMDPANGNGAAYVLISHGDNRAGAYSSAGTIQLANGIAASALEDQNANNQVMQAFYINAPQNIDTLGATHFDDILSYPSLHAVLKNAQLGARPRMQ